jgi:lipoprotein-releasing system permease protein
MASPLSLLIALRFSRGRRRGGMVSLISVISTIGIALGVAVLIVGLSAMNGFERELNNRILAVVPHGEIEPVNQPWNNWNEALAKVEKVKGIVAAAPYINFTGLVESGSNMRAIQVKGSTRSRKAASVRCLSLCRITRGPILKPANSRSFSVKGRRCAAREAGRLGVIMIPNSDAEHQLLQPKRVRLHVTGILQLSGQLDHSFAMIPMRMRSSIWRWRQRDRDRH